MDLDAGKNWRGMGSVGSLRLFLLLSCSTITAFADANDGWYAATGSAEPFGQKHPDIKMLAEDIRIDMSNLDAIVDVRFTFKNHGQRQRVTMAFPEKYGGPLDGGLSNFRSWVDGRSVNVRRRLIGDDGEARQWSAVWLKDVEFQRGQQRTVRVRYLAHYGGTTSGSYWLSYILTTGATWRGSIGECRISVDWRRMERLSKPEFDLMDGAARQVEWQPVGFRQRRLVLKDFVPVKNLELRMVTGFWSYAIDGNRVVQDAKGLSGATSRGAPHDPMIEISNLSRFFGKPSLRRDGNYQIKNWGHPAVARFGGPFSISNGRLVFDNSLDGRPLRRGVIKSADQRWGEGRYVYLKDVVEALGGQFRYHAGAERVDLSFL